MEHRRPPGHGDIAFYVTAALWPFSLAFALPILLVKTARGEVPARRGVSFVFAPLVALVGSFRSRDVERSAGFACVMPLLAGAAAGLILAGGGQLPLEHRLSQFAVGFGRLAVTATVSVATASAIGVVVTLPCLRPKGRASAEMLFEVLEAVPLVLVLIVLIGFTRAGEARLAGLWVNLFVGVVSGLFLSPLPGRRIIDRVDELRLGYFFSSLRLHGVPEWRIVLFHVLWNNSKKPLMLACVGAWTHVVLAVLALDFLLTQFPVVGGDAVTGWMETFFTRSALQAFLFPHEVTGIQWIEAAYPIFFVTLYVVGLRLVAMGRKVPAVSVLVDSADAEEDISTV